MQIRQLSQRKTYTAPTLAAPTYFFPNLLITEMSGGNGTFTLEIDPRGAAGGLSNVPSWMLFYLPFSITVTRYRFQVDTGAADGVFFAGLYSATGSLLFDIGAVAIVNAGEYGPGAAFDPGTVFFNNSNSPISSYALTAGWYMFGWGGRSAAASGTIHMPGMGPFNQLWDEQIQVDKVGLPSGVVARAGSSGGFDLSGVSHMPATLGHNVGSEGATRVPNFVLFA